MTAALEDAVRSAGDRKTDRILALLHDLHAHLETTWEEVGSSGRPS